MQGECIVGKRVSYRVANAYSFFFKAAVANEIYPLSLHDALPIFLHRALGHLDVQHIRRKALRGQVKRSGGAGRGLEEEVDEDRKSTRLNSSHVESSYAVFCVKKKKKKLYALQWLIKRLMSRPGVS